MENYCRFLSVNYDIYVLTLITPIMKKFVSCEKIKIKRYAVVMISLFCFNIGVLFVWDYADLS